MNILVLFAFLQSMRCVFVSVGRVRVLIHNINTVLKCSENRSFGVLYVVTFDRRSNRLLMNWVGNMFFFYFFRIFNIISLCLSRSILVQGSHSLAVCVRMLCLYLTSRSPFECCPLRSNQFVCICCVLFSSIFPLTPVIMIRFFSIPCLKEIQCLPRFCSIPVKYAPSCVHLCLVCNLQKYDPHNQNTFETIMPPTVQLARSMHPHFVTIGMKI